MGEFSKDKLDGPRIMVHLLIKDDFMKQYQEPTAIEPDEMAPDVDYPRSVTHADIDYLQLELTPVPKRSADTTDTTDEPPKEDSKTRP